MKILAYAVAALLLTMSIAAARPDVNIDDDGLAVHGYDLVAFFEDEQAVEGSSSHEIEHQGVTYRFANAGNAAAFSADPQRYLPAYGGFCSYGVAMGKKFDITPRAWKIVDNRLFFQLDQGTHAVWQSDISRNVAIADRIWPEIERTPASQLDK